MLQQTLECLKASVIRVLRSELLSMEQYYHVEHSEAKRSPSTANYAFSTLR